MSELVRNDPDVVEVSITIGATAATVFRFFSEPSQFAKWMGEASQLSPVQGGGLRIVYPTGDVACGQVELLEPNSRVVFSWGYEQDAHGIAPGSTRVEVVLREVEEGTRLTLRHSGLRDVGQRGGHRAGWRHYLATLGGVVAQLVGASAEDLIERYMAAWSETDPDRRRAALGRIWHPRGVFKDAMGYCEGIDDLADHIGIAQQFAPGARLERAGPISRAHGSIAYRWHIRGADQGVMMVGMNAMELAPDGRISEVTGFWSV
jgi:uncharacterized protein YndB with AHSA1/START domain